MEKEYHFMRKISILFRNSHTFFKNNLKGYDLGSGQFMHLMVLYKNPNINQDALSKIVNVDKATTSKAIKKLLENGYITKVHPKGDNRSFEIELTEKAYELKQEVDRIKREWDKLVLKNISDEEFDKFKDILKRMCENASEEKE